ncbi:twitching motility protein [Helicobacter aurati]|uniref:Twitching motility protein n=1 Tax=Helicobacter aurati TaxID=137778 RepID=A0A3D8J4F5_9HELI|nr:ATPase, T2SS/T4P/T4SS family [Helicobacter aurati]RDU72402.1 twitching motility protein [Helicobacter aurati]
MNSLYGLLQEAIKYNATDIHINSKIYLRINKQLFAYQTNHASEANYIESLKNTLCALLHRESYYNEVSETFSICPHETDSASITQQKTSSPIKCRVTAFLQNNNLCFALRLLRTKIPSLEELHAPKVLHNLALQESGLILVCGATSSGKSTTIAAMIEHINTYTRKHILTLEDPIEYNYTNALSCITQREIKTDSKDFHTALLSSLRQDPDVIVIGEILEKEVLKQAINHALSGHLVIASFHARNAVHAVSRILGMCQNEGNIHANLADSLQSIITQKLYEKEQKLQADYQVLVTNPAVQTLIKENQIQQLDSQISMGKEFGMQHFMQK